MFDKENSNLLFSQLYLSVIKHFPSSNGKVFTYRELLLENLGVSKSSIQEIKNQLMEEKIISSRNRLKIDKSALPDFEKLLYELDSLGILAS